MSWYRRQSRSFKILLGANLFLTAGVACCYAFSGAVHAERAKTGLGTPGAIRQETLWICLSPVPASSRWDSRTGPLRTHATVPSDSQRTVTSSPRRVTA